jgi:hypothetical protein
VVVVNLLAMPKSPFGAYEMPILHVRGSLHACARSARAAKAVRSSIGARWSVYETNFVRLSQDLEDMALEFWQPIQHPCARPCDVIAGIDGFDRIYR